MQEEARKTAVPYLIYYRIFKEGYNISFYTPKKHQCELCAAYEIANASDKNEINGRYEKHWLQKDLSRLEKQKDKECADFVAVYDLQTVLPCPRESTSTFFYVSKLNVFNFTIYNLKSN
ncbi:hypothetical protein RN001_014387 [Aquatica leii]|uniref:Uncharacterized protein n=1 Tax=Aquatica leii TaxID=1421715 RepID=A0AAN7QBL2_9COLE|nr:hypothetical protein RN001_014387 [Aquatica leii]